MTKLKKIAMFFLVLVISSVCFAQSFDFIEDVVNTKEVTFLQVATLVAQDLNLIQNSVENSEITKSLITSFPKLEKITQKYEANLENPIQVRDFSQIICTCYNAKSSLMYIIFSSPRYAFRQLIGSGYFPMTMQPDAKLSGVKALSVIADFGEKAGETK